jgi:hypothetical protein
MKKNGWLPAQMYRMKGRETQPMTKALFTAATSKEAGMRLWLFFPPNLRNGA